MAGTIVNFEALKGHDDMVTHLYSTGKLSTAQAEIALRTARAIHAEKESRMDNFHVAACDAVDALMEAPLKSIMSNRKG